MIDGKTVLAVILARGGSKGISKKNIYPICGKPLIVYTIEQALLSPLIDKLVVSTDSDEIRQISIDYGAEAPFNRPVELSGDTVWSRDALKHAIIETERITKTEYNYIIELPCVSPLRTAEDINEALHLLSSSGATAVTSVCQMADKHPIRMKRIDNGRLTDFSEHFPEGEGSRRQDLQPEAFIRNGAIYAMTRKTIVEDFSRHGNDCRPYIMPLERSINIDGYDDIDLVKSMIRSKLYGCASNSTDSRPVDNPNVLITAPLGFLDNYDEYLEQFNAYYSYGEDIEQLLNQVPDIEYWIVDPGASYFIDATKLDKLKQLKAILTPSTGVNHIDTEYCGSRDISIISLMDREFLNSIHASAEYTFMLILASARRYVHASQCALNGLWRDNSDILRGCELNGKRLGLIGYGRIGRKLEQFASAFEMIVTHNDPVSKSSIELDKLVSTNDIVVACCRLNNSSIKLVDSDLISKMNGIIFINTSRGEIVDSNALIDGIKKGNISQAAIDVIDNEQNYKGYHDLVAFANTDNRLTISPHIAGLTKESQTKAIGFILSRLETLIHGP